MARLDVESLLVEISQNEIPPRSVVNAKQAYAIQPKIIENLSKADISSQKARSYDIRLYNIQGVLLKNAKSNGERISLDVSSLVDGNYFLHIYESGLNEPQIQKIPRIPYS